MTLVRKYFLLGLVVSILLGTVFAFLGVYNTSSMPYYKRFVFWTSTMVVGMLATGFSFPWVINRLMPGQHRFVQLITITLLISVPVTFVLAGFDHNYARDWSIDIWLIQYTYVLVISFILIFGGYFILKAQGLIDSTMGSEETNTQDKQANALSNTNTLLKRLPHSYQAAELYAVSSEDHYLRVHTNLGEALILMRLSDAMSELVHVPGMQTHRSWWVAQDAVVARQRINGKQMLLLKSGTSVPVSRTYDKAVKEAEFDLQV